MEENKIVEAKNYLPDEIVREMYIKAFNKSSDNISIKHLSGGLKSAVYLIEDNGNRVVLKVAPENNVGIITADKNTFNYEVQMLKLMEKVDIPTPRVLYYDDSCSLCSTSYFFMTYLEGINYFEKNDTISDEDKKRIEYKLGRICKKITSLKADKFHIPSNPNKTFKDNYDFILYLFELLFEDASRNGLDITSTISNIKEILESRKKELTSNIQISLSHIDLWDGNILVKNGNITGVVDFSDLYCCDELMTFYFHTIDGIDKKEFLRGYGKEELTHDEKIRIEIYRMYILLKMIVECHLKNFGKNEFMYNSLNERMNNLHI